MSQPLVSIITVNYNQTDATCELLTSLQNCSYKNIEVWVVDNASIENPKEKIASLFPDVRIILSNKNLGFAGGNNLAIKQAKGEYLMFLNNDTEVAPDFLEPLVEIMQTRPKVGICASKIHFFIRPTSFSLQAQRPCTPTKSKAMPLATEKKTRDNTTKQRSRIGTWSSHDATGRCHKKSWTNARRIFFVLRRNRLVRKNQASGL